MTGFPSHGRSLVADASSLIYLAKSSLIRPFAQTFSVTVPSLVYQECVQKGYPGSDLIKALQQKGWLCVRPVREDSFLPLALPEGGEREVITLYYQLAPDGVLIDDGVGVKICRNRGIPFISALLIPSLLFTRKAIGKREAEESLEKIVKVGRYSQNVIRFARNTLSRACTGNDSSPFGEQPPADNSKAS